MASQQTPCFGRLLRCSMQISLFIATRFLHTRSSQSSRVQYLLSNANKLVFTLKRPSHAKPAHHSSSSSSRSSRCTNHKRPQEGAAAHTNTNTHTHTSTTKQKQTSSSKLHSSSLKQASVVWLVHIGTTPNAAAGLFAAVDDGATGGTITAPPAGTAAAGGAWWAAFWSMTKSIRLMPSQLMTFLFDTPLVCAYSFMRFRAFVNRSLSTFTLQSTALRNAICSRPNLKLPPSKSRKSAAVRPGNSSDSITEK
mmetsp:Transcript_11918/g.25931  ORF Transcript_11918/g.25931 Transcript_11918/m.25931 type:complete len:252 (-) Transcript_11918:676-1431(-)